MEINKQLKTEVFLSIQRALLGAISPEVRAITVQFKKKVIITVIIDGPLSEDILERFSVVETEVMADFLEDIIELEVIRIDFPQDCEIFSGRLVYLRLEPTQQTS
jgi:hypothetical protein